MNKDKISINMNVDDIPIIIEMMRQLKAENKELKQRLEDIEEHLRSYDIKKLSDKEKVMIDNVLLIKKGTIKVARHGE